MMYGCMQKREEDDLPLCCVRLPDGDEKLGEYSSSVSPSVGILGNCLSEPRPSAIPPPGAHAGPHLQVPCSLNFNQWRQKQNRMEARLPSSRDKKVSYIFILLTMFPPLSDILPAEDKVLEYVKRVNLS